ncbi:hypothetical protein LEP1GSC059_4292 [Leptospira noguchii serovar Panama str. CZ214]|uniref:Uncharacterized protein n=1 Tax=Leptospira noguchii serovar Panama str. CZ214 TaxID=1001595 RepID=T0GT77_9LEPT|nr:hypothetical protein LEP1GSC059_4292 [Leptospira noguchii serovar Panama str. CZ214]
MIVPGKNKMFCSFFQTSYKNKNDHTSFFNKELNSYILF